MDCLTPRQIEVMDCFCRLGSQKLVARELGLSLRSVQGICRRVRMAIGTSETDRLLYILEYDRQRRQEWNSFSDLR